MLPSSFPFIFKGFPCFIYQLYLDVQECLNKSIHIEQYRERFLFPLPHAESLHSFHTLLDISSGCLGCFYDSQRHRFIYLFRQKKDKSLSLPHSECFQHCKHIFLSRGIWAYKFAPSLWAIHQTS